MKFDYVIDNVDDRMEAAEMVKRLILLDMVESDILTEEEADDYAAGTAIMVHTSGLRIFNKLRDKIDFGKKRENTNRHTYRIVNI